MCKNGRRPKDGPSVEWLACILLGYVSGYRVSNGWTVGGMETSGEPRDGVFYVEAGDKRFKVTVEEL